MKKFERTLDFIAANTVVADLRFPNEAAMIHRRGGIVVRLSRTGMPAVSGGSQHKSESSWEALTPDLRYELPWLHETDYKALFFKTAWDILRRVEEGSLSS